MARSGTGTPGQQVQDVVAEAFGESQPGPAPQSKEGSGEDSSSENQERFQVTASSAFRPALRLGRLRRKQQAPDPPPAEGTCELWRISTMAKPSLNVSCKGRWATSTNSQLQEDGSNVDLTQSTPGAAEGGALSACSWGTPSLHGHFWGNRTRGPPDAPTSSGTGSFSRVLQCSSPHQYL